MKLYRGKITVSRTYEVKIAAPNDELAEDAVWSADTQFLHLLYKIGDVEVGWVEVEERDPEATPEQIEDADIVVAADYVHDNVNVPDMSDDSWYKKTSQGFQLVFDNQRQGVLEISAGRTAMLRSLLDAFRATLLPNEPSAPANSLDGSPPPALTDVPVSVTLLGRLDGEASS